MKQLIDDHYPASEMMRWKHLCVNHALDRAHHICKTHAWTGLVRFWSILLAQLVHPLPGTIQVCALLCLHLRRRGMVINQPLHARLKALACQLARPLDSSALDFIPVVSAPQDWIKACGSLKEYVLHVVFAISAKMLAACRSSGRQACERGLEQDLGAESLPEHCLPDTSSCPACFGQPLHLPQSSCHLSHLCSWRHIAW